MASDSRKPKLAVRDRSEFEHRKKITRQTGKSEETVVKILESTGKYFCDVLP